MNIHALIRPLVPLLVGLAALAHGQSISKENIHEFAEGSGEFADRSAALAAGLDYLKKTSIRDSLRPAVAFHVGSLLVQSGRALEAVDIYEAGLKSTATTPSQRVSFLSNQGTILAQNGKPDVARTKFRSALDSAGSSPPGQKKLLHSWLTYLDLRSSDESLVAKTALKVLRQVDQGNGSPELLRDCQTVFETPTKGLDQVLFDKIVQRVIVGEGEADIALLNVAFSSFQGFDNGYPSVGPFGEQANSVQNRLEELTQSENALRAQTSWSQALHDVDRQKALEFTAKIVSGLRTSSLTQQERDAAINLVHELESLASSRDQKAQLIIDEKLKQLNARTIVTRSESHKEVNSTSVIPLFVIFAIVSVLSLALLAAVRRKARR